MNRPKPAPEYDPNEYRPPGYGPVNGFAIVNFDNQPHCLGCYLEPPPWLRNISQLIIP
jgi:hypothetical protein